MKSRIISAAAVLATLSLPIFAQMPGAMKQTVGVAAVEEIGNVQSRRYTGQVVAQAEVNVVPRVSGEILKLGFKDGDIAAQIKDAFEEAVEECEYQS